VFLTRGCFDGGDDLASHAELGESSEGGVLLDLEIADRLIQTDHPFLDDVFLVRSRKEIRTRLGSSVVAIAVEKHLDGSLAALAGEGLSGAPVPRESGRPAGDTTAALSEQGGYTGWVVTPPWVATTWTLHDS